MKLTERQCKATRLFLLTVIPQLLKQSMQCGWSRRMRNEESRLPSDRPDRGDAARRRAGVPVAGAGHCCGAHAGALPAGIEEGRWAEPDSQPRPDATLQG